MKRKPTLWLAALAVAFIVPLGITSASADVIMDWNAKADAIAAKKNNFLPLRIAAAWR